MSARSAPWDGNRFPFSRRGFCARALRHGTNKNLQTNKGRRSAERRGGRYRGPADRRCRPCFAFVAARAAFGGRARLSALYRGSRQSLTALAQSGPALHGRGQPIRSPGSQLLAGRLSPAGRLSEPPERALRNRARAPRSLHLQDPIRNVPCDERADAALPYLGLLVKYCPCTGNQYLILHAFSGGFHSPNQGS